MTRITRSRRTAVTATIMCLGCLGLTTGASLAQGTVLAPGAVLVQGTAAAHHHKKPAAHHHHSAKKHHKKSAVGSGLGGVDINATTAATEIPAYEHQGEDVQISIPYATSSLASGGAGSALSSVFWPGQTGASGGSALQLLNVPVPTNIAQMLNDPEVAKAQSGVGNPTVTVSKTGAVMTATATSTHVSANASAGGGGVPVFGSIVGTTSAATKIQVRGPHTVVVTATNAIHNLSVDKVVAIKSISTRMHAVSNAKAHTAKGTEKTTVSGVTIAGVPVTIDNKGLHITAGKKSLLPPLLGSTVDNSASSVVNAALKGAGFNLALTPAKKKIHKAHVKLAASSLVLKQTNTSFKSQDNSTGDVLILAGGTINAVTAPSFPTKAPKPIKAPKTQTPAPSTAGSTGGTAGIPGTPGTSGTVSSVPPSGQAPETAGEPQQLAADPAILPNGLSPWWIVAALVVAGLFAFGMKRLPDQVLAASAATCSLEENA